MNKKGKEAREEFDKHSTKLPQVMQALIRYGKDDFEEAEITFQKPEGATSSSHFFWFMNDDERIKNKISALSDKTYNMRVADKVYITVGG